MVITADPLVDHPTIAVIAKSLPVKFMCGAAVIFTAAFVTHEHMLMVALIAIPRIAKRMTSKDSELIATIVASEEQQVVAFPTEITIGNVEICI
jgi:hypothetical protein